ncbi:MAG: RdgB/HAM1 family non-canonical purine NTP pyrophosphatase [Clostridia bacterium]
MDLLIASNNENKIREFKQILGNRFENVYSLKDCGINIDIEENGETFLENAIIKVLALRGRGFAVLADDSGLCVDALGGEPGVKSARYNSVDGHNCSDKSNREKLLQKMEKITVRSACFISALALLCDSNLYTAVGMAKGNILYKQEGESGFGYDCIFYSNELKKSFGQATEEEKNSVSHRKIATEKLIKNFDNNVCENV